MITTPLQAVIFDMDGVIFDSEKVYFDAFFVAAEKHNVDVEDAFVHGFAGKTTAACRLIVHNFFQHDSDKTQRFFYDWAQARLDILHTSGLPFKEGFKELFNSIQTAGLPIGLVTSANAADVTENFARNNASDILAAFSHIITIEDVQHPKPHPQPYTMMMDHLALPPEQCVVVEDSEPGASAAISAGANTIMINQHSDIPLSLEEQLLIRVNSHSEIVAFLSNHM